MSDKSEDEERADELKQKGNEKFKGMVIISMTSNSKEKKNIDFARYVFTTYFVSFWFYRHLFR
jgi:hypothetical protein